MCKKEFWFAVQYSLVVFIRQQITKVKLLPRHKKAKESTSRLDEMLEINTHTNNNNKIQESHTRKRKIKIKIKNSSRTTNLYGHT